VVWECDWAHHASIGGGGSVGDGPSERWQRGCGGAPTAARVLAKLKAGMLNVCLWELERVLGEG
jgi:hypothetical protein